MRTIVFVLILALILLSGVALASDASDVAAPHVRRLVNSVEGMTGWDCQYRIAETEHLFATLVWCEK
jgi:hypothetical protein